MILDYSKSARVPESGNPLKNQYRCEREFFLLLDFDRALRSLLARCLVVSRSDFPFLPCFPLPIIQKRRCCWALTPVVSSRLLLFIASMLEDQSEDGDAVGCWDPNEGCLTVRDGQGGGDVMGPLHLKLGMARSLARSSLLRWVQKADQSTAAWQCGGWVIKLRQFKGKICGMDWWLTFEPFLLNGRMLRGIRVKELDDCFA